MTAAGVFGLDQAADLAMPGDVAEGGPPSGAGGAIALELGRT
jgi:hypothetical protein